MCFTFIGSKKRFIITLLFLTIFTHMFYAVQVQDSDLLPITETIDSDLISRIETLLTEQKLQITKFIVYKFNVQLFIQLFTSPCTVPSRYWSQTADQRAPATNVSFISQLQPSLLKDPKLMIEDALADKFKFEKTNSALKHIIVKSRVDQKKALERHATALILSKPADLKSPKSIDWLLSKTHEYELENMPRLYLAQRIISQVKEQIELLSSHVPTSDRVQKAATEGRSIARLALNSKLSNASATLDHTTTNGCSLQETGNLMFTLAMLAEFSYFRADAILKTVCQEYNKQVSKIQEIQTTAPTQYALTDSKGTLEAAVRLQFAIETLKQLQKQTETASVTKYRLLKNRVSTGIDVLEYLVNYIDPVDLSASGGLCLKYQRVTKRTATDDQKLLLEKIDKLRAILDPVVEERPFAPPHLTGQDIKLPKMSNSGLFSVGLTRSILEEKIRLQETKLKVEIKTLVPAMSNVPPGSVKKKKHDSSTTKKKRDSSTTTTPYAIADQLNVSDDSQSPQACNPTKINQRQIASIATITILNGMAHPTLRMTAPGLQLVKGVANSVKFQLAKLKTQTKEIRQTVTAVLKSITQVSQFVTSSAIPLESQKIGVEQRHAKKRLVNEQLKISVQKLHTLSNKAKVTIEHLSRALTMVDRISATTQVAPTYKRFYRTQMYKYRDTINSQISQTTAILGPLDEQLVSAKIVYLRYKELLALELTINNLPKTTVVGRSEGAQEAVPAKPKAAAVPANLPEFGRDTPWNILQQVQAAAARPPLALAAAVPATAAAGKPAGGARAAGPPPLALAAAAYLPEFSRGISQRAQTGVASLLAMPIDLVSSRMSARLDIPDMSTRLQIPPALESTIRVGTQVNVSSGLQSEIQTEPQSGARMPCPRCEQISELGRPVTVDLCSNPRLSSESSTGLPIYSYRDVGPDLFRVTDTGTGTGTDTGTGKGKDIRTGTGKGKDTGTGKGKDIRTGTGKGKDTGTGKGKDTGTGKGKDTGNKNKKASTYSNPGLTVLIGVVILKCVVFGIWGFWKLMNVKLEPAYGYKIKHHEALNVKLKAIPRRILYSTGKNFANAFQRIANLRRFF